MEAYQSPLQALLMSVAAFLTMLGCGLGNVITDMMQPQFGSDIAPVTIDRSDPAAVARQFVEDVTQGDYVGASTYLCSEAIPGFMALDPAGNALLGADTSELIPVVDITGDTAKLTFDGRVVLDPGTSDEFPIPGHLIPFTNIDMVNRNGEWALCPAELIQ